MNGDQAIDPNGCTVDVARTCWVTRMRPWLNDDTEVKVRWYRGAPGAPDLAFPHQFGLDFLWDDRLQLDPEPGQVGTLYLPRDYNKGKRPVVYAPDGSYVGSQEQWAVGSVRGRDPVLTPTVVESTVECLAQLGVRIKGILRGPVLDGQMG